LDFIKAAVTAPASKESHPVVEPAAVMMITVPSGETAAARPDHGIICAHRLREERQDRII